MQNLKTHANGLITLIAVSTLVTGCSAVPPASTAPYSFKSTDTSLALMNGDNIVWQLNYDEKEDKPYFHPVALTDGTVLTELRPPDHVWHRGLWWSWKTINRLNYWEEDKVSHLANERNEITAVKLKTHPDKSADAEIHISYHPRGRPPVLTEKRLLKISPPDEKGIYYIDWKSTFTAKDKDAVLERTPVLGQPNGVAWGGYAGLSVRFADIAKNWRVVDSEANTYNKEFNTAKAPWCDYTIEPTPGKPAGIVIFDHPDNPRHPTPWYVILGPGMKYFSPAFLFYEPYTLKANDTLTLKYRILIHPGRTDRSMLEDQWQTFSKLKW